LQNFDRARQDFDAVIEMAPSLAAAYSGRGYAWIQMGEQEKAKADFREAITCEPAQADAFELHRLLAQAAYCHAREQFEESIKLSTEALELSDDQRVALGVRAAAHWYDEQYVEAIDDYSRILEQEDSPGSRFSALGSRGQILVELGDYEAGLADLNAALQLANAEESPIHRAYVLSGRALAYAGLKMLDHAWADFSASIKGCPENAWVHYNHGRVYDMLGEPYKAAVCFDLALALNEPPLTPRKRTRAAAYVAKNLPRE
jgi:tetratricopeptide (TPR) repeat protein